MMNRIRSFIYHATFTALVAVGCFIGADSAIAQEANDDQTSEVMEEVVKFEAALDRRLVGRQNEFGARTKLFELKRQVKLADLDLSADTDVIKLKNRIESTAKEACAELAEIRPIPLWAKADHQRCITEAIESANDELELIVAAL
jgi:UrcA family protein